ncbi:hypothetical protein GLAREA_07769 [Glarea lozoyensis ATCC 20868]|uniref:Serine-threonine protein kinase 19 n=1 Tax=Glarea lozoyensis (strain ATCC 20868 / MF5171) TaxID=1116229 RepID=S3D492_GLAL2|nr:uncharacterized protein GLAREA_07769 [Glarea lozoyensis ATCC 20868]EPE32635.1 hypothetical protein GLAREA_07769 [Glarea lozoyensis ATCC 20868]
MSFRATPAFSSGIKKPKKPAAFKRSSSGSNPYSALARRKPISRSSTKPEEPDEDFFGERLDDLGLVRALAEDLTLRDVPQAMLFVQRRMWSVLPEQRTGMNSTRIAEVLNFRTNLPPVVTVSHVQALLNSPTVVEREIADLVRRGAVRKIVVGGRGHLGEILILVREMQAIIERSMIDTELKRKFVALLGEHPTALKISSSRLAPGEIQQLMQAGFLTSATPSWTTSDAFSKPGEGSRGTMTSLNSISKAASGSLAAVGGEGAVHAAGGSGGGAKTLSTQAEYSLSLPTTGPFLKLLANARAHFMSLLSKSKYREAPESLLLQRWDGGVAADDEASAARRSRGEFAGILPGKTRKWKLFYGVSFDWILAECVGAGLVEVFNTGSVGRGIRAL